MDKTAVYTNSNGESVELGGASVWQYADTDLHDYLWDYETVNDAVSQFARKPKDFSLPAIMRGGSLEERNRVVDVFEADVAAKVPGTLRVGECEMRCWVIGSAKSRWHFDDGVMHADLTVHADDPVWSRERTLEFYKEPQQPQTGYLDYPVGYPYDYKRDDRATQFEAPFGVPCRFRLTFYGPVESPYVIIGGNRYQVDASVPQGGILTVDSVAGTIVLKGATGSESDAFASGVREKGARIFEPMPAGAVDLSWSGAFGFSLTYVEERSEPVWS